MAFGELDLYAGAIVRGARIGVCAKSLIVNRTAAISADSLGCRSATGPGSKLVTNTK